MSTERSTDGPGLAPSDAAAEGELYIRDLSSTADEEENEEEEEDGIVTTMMVGEEGDRSGEK